ncbi:hypothetical protein V491_05851 [Pseudogymnoascus sp. VKM F-3775]|nr:hypothetical protein V491_05851 [Pseudogymnoascus sp. VKM F-3775]
MGDLPAMQEGIILAVGMNFHNSGYTQCDPVSKGAAVRVTEAVDFAGILSAMQKGIILAPALTFFMGPVVALLLGAKYRQRRGGGASYACNGKGSGTGQ